MKSKRTISYIGLWALVLPWLGFSWKTTIVLFSLTGVVLLIIGNRQYHNEKKKQKTHTGDLPTEDINIKNQESITDTNSYYDKSGLDNNTIKTESLNFTNDNPVSTIKPKTRKRVEMAPRVKRLTIKKETNFINDDININQNHLPDFS